MGWKTDWEAQNSKIPTQMQKHGRVELLRSTVKVSASCQIFLQTLTRPCCTYTGGRVRYPVCVFYSLSKGFLTYFHTIVGYMFMHIGSLFQHTICMFVEHVERMVPYIYSTYNINELKNGKRRT